MYSQFGEDQFIEKYLVDNQIYIEPLIVDIGAGDGETISNSKLFVEKYHYKAVLVEPNKTVADKAANLYVNNPDVVVLNLFIDGKAGRGVLTDSPEWTVRTLKRSTSKGSIEIVTLSQIIRNLSLNKIGILSIDAEGCDTRILEEFLKASRLRPEIIVIEGNDEKEKGLQRNLLEKDYDLLTTLNVNQIFAKKGLSKNVKLG